MAYVNVAEWKPEQVTEWLKGLDNAVLNHVHSFLNNEVTGKQLLNLRPDDLDHLGVYKLGHQELILEAVEHLRNFHYELDRENLQLLALRLSCRARSLYKELLHHTDSEPVKTQTLADVANIITAVKPIACWLGRSPFAGHFDYHHRKMAILKLSLEIATCAQRDRFAERPVEEIRSSCDQLATLADSIIREIQDPLLLQPASLDLATVKKRAGDDLGFFIQPSFHGVHQISEIKFSSPAHQCGKIEEGDEVVQVNYQTVVGWQSKKVMFLLEESPTDVFLTLKKRPRHNKVYGQIYIKPYRLPSKKRATPYTRWHENLPSPRPELLTIPDFELPLSRSSKRNPQPASLPLLDTEPLPSSSSSDADDDDDTAFLPGAVDLGQASPTSMRLYLPKQRVSVQRRATVTGASPTSRRPPVNFQQLWQELRKEHQWRESAPGGDTELCQLRNKSIGISGSLISVTAAVRPTTCLGIEKNVSHCNSAENQNSMKTIDCPIREENKNQHESENLASSNEPEEKCKIQKKKILITDNKEIDKKALCFQEYHFTDKIYSKQMYCSRNFEIMDACEMSETSYVQERGYNLSRKMAPLIHVTADEDSRENNKKESVLGTTKKEYLAVLIAEECKAESSYLRETDKTNYNPLDEKVLNIPSDNMKYIDDTSDTNVHRDNSDYDMNQEEQNDYKKTSKILVSTGEHEENIYKYQDRFTKSNIVENVCGEGTKGNVLIQDNPQKLYAPRNVKCINVDSAGDSQIPALRLDNVPKYNAMVASSSPSLQQNKLSNVDVTGKSSNLRSENEGEIVSKLSNYKVKLPHPLSQLGGGKPSLGASCSPKSVKKRNILLAKRRNVNLKELGQPDFEGWLLHRCRWSGASASLGTTWMRAWFILKGSLFYGFKSPHASKANIMISLPGFTVSVAEEVKSKKFAFKVYHTGTVFYFAAESEHLFNMWLNSLALGTISQEPGKCLDLVDVLFSETDEESEHEIDTNTGMCFPSPKSYKFGTLLGGSNSSNSAHSHQNLASDAKIGHEVQKKFGSLKKLGRRVTDSSSSGSSTLHNDAGGSSSLDRKYLCFLGNSRNSTVPVPTAQFRSYRRVPSSAHNKVPIEVYGQRINEMPRTLNASTDKDCASLLKDPYRNLRDPHMSTARNIKLNTTKSQEEKEVGTSFHSMNPTKSNLDFIKEKDAHFSCSEKCQFPERLLRPGKVCDLRERNIHASNPSLQLSADISDYRLAAERLREFNVQRSRQREDTSGFVTLEAFMLSRQEEERRSSSSSHSAGEHKLEAYQQSESHNQSHETTKRNIFPASQLKNAKVSSQISEQSLTGLDCKSTNENIPANMQDSHGTPNTLKSAAQYQPPPVSQFECDQPLTLAFEMHLGERGATSTKTSKFRNIFTSKSHQPQHHLRQSHLEVASPNVPDKQKTLLGSPRLHRAIFRDKYNASSKGSSSDSNSSSFSPTSPVVPSLCDGVAEGHTDTSIAQIKPTMGISMLGKRPSRRVLPTSPQQTPPPVTPPPDYPGLEYPPVFEPETYTLSDASTLIRSRSSRTHLDK